MLNNLETSDKKEWSEIQVSGDIPPPRDGHSACLINSRLYLFGGEAEGNEVYVLDMETYKWSRPEVKGKSPEGRSGHACLAIGKYMLLFGGCSEGQVFNDTYLLDTESMEWIEVNMDILPTGRAGHSLAVIEHAHVVLFGGETSDTEGDMETLNDLWVLDFRSLLAK